MFTVSATFSQYGKQEDPFKGDLEKNIFRVTASLYDIDWKLFAFSYEREIIVPITATLKAGLCLDSDLFAGGRPQSPGLNAFASAEFRYYFILKKRIRKKKFVRNFSGIYIALEQSVISSTIIASNKPHSRPLDRTTGTFVNIGYQVQLGQGYFTMFTGLDLNSNGPVGQIYHFGLGVGIVLFQ